MQTPGGPDGLTSAYAGVLGLVGGPKTRFNGWNSLKIAGNRVKPELDGSNSAISEVNYPSGVA
jgi:hypothetical protein